MLKNILIIHNVRSVTNVGAMFRTADAVGINKIYLTGYTPTPLDRFGKKRGDLTKSALGAEEFVSWEYKKSLITLLNKLKWEKYLIIGIEQAENSVDYKKISARGGPAFGWKGGLVLIVGAEVAGISKNILKRCDVIAEIPMRGKLARNRLPDDVGKESLNVSVACGVALFRILNL